MTIPATASQISYAGNGVTLAFPIPFVFDTSADIKVISTDSAGQPTVLTTGFSITGGGGSTGTCTFLVAPAALTSITLLDNPELTQTADYIDNDSFPAESHERALDRTVRQVKRLSARVDRSIRVADGDLSNGDDLLLPVTAIRKGLFLVFDANGKPNVASGVGGADSALRTDLANVNIGSSLIAIPRTAAEISAAVVPSAPSIEPGDPSRYASLAQAAAVYVQVNTLARYTGWYRGDRAQHPQLTNCIVGLGAYDDSQMTGTTGYRCTAFGVNTLRLNSTSVTGGGSNTAVGYGSQQNSVSTSGNTGCGTFTLASCTGVLSAHNGAFGNSTLEALVTGTQNNAFAYRAMYQLLRGDNNTAMGDVVLQGLIAGNANTAYGAQAGFTKQGGNYLSAFGYQACFHEAAALISGISKAASAVVTLSTVSGANPYVVNDYVTFSDVGGMTEINYLSGIVTAVGGVSGAWTVTVAINSTAFTTYTSGGYLGPHGNIGIGFKTQFENVYASGNTTCGTEAASTAALGIGNSIYGFQAGRVINGAAFNSIFGWRAGLTLSSGSANCLYGQHAGVTLTTGASNVLLGNSAGSSITTGSNNTCVGTAAGTANGSNRTNIGFNAQCIADNTITLGDTNIIQIRAQVTVITAISDRRFKKNIQQLASQLPDGFMQEVETVLFEWIQDDMPKGVQVGIIAQQLDELQTKYGVEWLGLVDKTNPARWEATPGKLLMPLILSHQRLSARVAVIEQRLAA